MIVVKDKDWQFLSRLLVEVAFRSWVYECFLSWLYECLSQFFGGTSSRGKQRSKDAFVVVKECLSEVGLESHLKKENWYCKDRGRSALEWKLFETPKWNFFESLQVVFDSVLMPVGRVLPHISQPRVQRF